jgi:hypothetical protein
VLDESEELEEDFKECMNHTVTPDEFDTQSLHPRSAHTDSYRRAKNIHKSISAGAPGVSNRPEMEWIWTGLTSFLASHAHQ